MSKYVLNSEDEADLEIIEQRSGKKYSAKDREMIQKLILFSTDERNINWKACSVEKLDKYRQLALETGDQYTYNHWLEDIDPDRIRTEIGQVYPANGMTKAEIEEIIEDEGIKNQIGDNSVDLFKNTLTYPDGKTVDVYSVDGDMETTDDLTLYDTGFIGVLDNEVITKGWDIHRPIAPDGMIHIPMTEMSKYMLEAIVLSHVIFS